MLYSFDGINGFAGGLSRQFTKSYAHTEVLDILADQEPRWLTADLVAAGVETEKAEPLASFLLHRGWGKTGPFSVGG